MHQQNFYINLKKILEKRLFIKLFLKQNKILLTSYYDFFFLYIQIKIIYYIFL